MSSDDMGGNAVEPQVESQVEPEVEPKSDEPKNHEVSPEDEVDPGDRYQLEVDGSFAEGGHPLPTWASG
jgi:hypothetical protein